jgi:hypothetical protein
LRRDAFAPRRWILPLLCILLFLVTLAAAVLYSLPQETILSPLRSALGRRGMALSCEEVRIGFPFRILLAKPSIQTAGGGIFPLESVTAAWEWTGLFRWLPVHVRAERDRASLDLRTSPLFTNPGKVRLSLARVGSEDLSAFLPADSGIGFLLESLDIRLGRTGSQDIAGEGAGSFEWLRFPVPSADSPVREAMLRNVKLKFVIRQGTLHVSSLTGEYEGSEIEGTGEVAKFLTPSLSSITFHLRIRNPFEGRTGLLFDMVAKNAKNANLRVFGPLLSPAGEFHFF